MCRTFDHKIIIRIGFRCGGPSIIFPKIPKKFIQKGFGSIFSSIIACIISIQFFYRLKSGILDRYLKEQRLLKRNKAARVIQNNFKAFKWNKLLIGMRQNNKVRRIQRCMRKFKFRKIIQFKIFNTKAIKIQKFVKKYSWFKKLYWKFRYRLVLLKTVKRVQQYSAIRIQRLYRFHLLLEEGKKEEIRKRIELELKLFRLRVLNAIIIQRWWKCQKARIALNTRIQRRIYCNIELKRIRMRTAAKCIQNKYKNYRSWKIHKETLRRNKAIKVILRAYISFLRRVALGERIKLAANRKLGI